MRDARDATFERAPANRRAAFEAFVAEVGRTNATWDPATSVPHRLLLEGLSAPGTVHDPAAAETVARELLERHLALLAPGTAATDFVLVANDLSAGIRSVGFEQHHHGRPVLGGQVSFRFKHDRLVMIGSGAYPDVVVPARSHSASAGRASYAAQRWVLRDATGSLAAQDAVEGPFVLPLVDAAGHITYREVLRTSLTLAHPESAWTVYLDADSGDPVAREQTLLYGDSQLLLDVPLRNPAGPRTLMGADTLQVELGGQPTTTDPSGFLTYPGPTSTVLTSMTGVFAQVTDETGPTPSVLLPLADGANAVWAEPGEEGEANLTAYAHTMLVKNFVRNFADIPWLDEAIPITVNIADTCNAFSDGNSINFFARGGGCENTALLADVVYHEFGHSLHAQSLIPGVGQFNTSLSEGISDYLASTLTEDSGLGRGFFLNDQPLRDFDPDGFEYRWPEDRGEVHDEGRIIGGALWDLRKRMIDKLGPEAGAAYVDRLYYETTRRAVDIPSMYPEALLFDDDDGNLANGTPNACDINAAYGPHGLFNPGAANERVTLTDDADGSVVRLELALPSFPDCPIAAAPSLSWRVRGDSNVNSEPLVPQADGSYLGRIPTQAPNTVIEYQVQPGYDIDTARTLPDNLVDPWYQHYVGEVIELGCLGSDTGFGTSGAWMVGPWEPDSSGSDPDTPFATTTHVWQPGDYPPNSTSQIFFDPVDTGPYTQVRLQFQRWLAVEDGFYDQASIRINDQVLWSNHASSEDFLASFHHVDQEWRFVDFDISEFVGPEGVSITFQTRSDGGLEFGGWSLADVCVVAVDGPTSSCGNGVLEAPETCDDGNVEPGDGCDAVCQEEPGPLPPEEPEDPTDPGDDPSDDDAPSFDGEGLIDRGCACTGGSNGPGSAALLLVLLGLRRRRRD